MNKQPKAHDREENIFDEVDVALDPARLSRFLAEEGGSFADDGGMDSERKKSINMNPSGLMLQRPLFYQRPTDLADERSDVGTRNVIGPKPARYVSETHVMVSSQPKYSTQISPVPKPVEYISGIQVTHSTSGNKEETYPAGDLNTRVQKQKSATIISNFLTKFTKEPVSPLKSSTTTTTRSTKQIVSLNINESSAPLTKIPHILNSSNEDSSPTKTTEFSSTEVSSETFTTRTSTTYQTRSTFEYTEATELPKHAMGMIGEIPRRNGSLMTLTNQGSSTRTRNIDNNIIGRKQVSSSEIRTGAVPSKASTSTDGDYMPPPLPDQPPPLPSVPPPSLSMSGSMVTSITPEEADFITVYLKSLKTGGMDTATSTSPKSVQPLSTDSSYSKYHNVKSDHPTKPVSTSHKTSTLVVSQKPPKIIRSSFLPVWPPLPEKPDSTPAPTSVSSDSSSSESQWEDAEDVELRDNIGRDLGNKTSEEASLGKNGSVVTSWDTGYAESYTSSHISWGSQEQRTLLGPESDYEDFQKKLDEGKEAGSHRESIRDILRTNSDAGRKSKPRWHKSVDEVIADGLSEKKLQLLELEFEIITTEAEYFSRVEFLKKNFLVRNVKFNKKDTLRSDSKKNIFLDLDEVCSCSEKLLADLDNCWQKSIYLEGIYDVVMEHSKANVNAFINYCAEYEGVIEKIAVLRKEDRKFEELVSSLEEGKPDLSEQLKAPMNRIIQLNLLLKNCQDVMAHLSKTEYLDVFTIEYDSCRSATESVAQLCTKIDEVTGMRRRVQKIIEIQECLEFPLQMTQLSLASQNRWLVKKGAVTQNGYLILNTGNKQTFKKSNSVLTIFLFNDLIILTKKKSEECHVVKDYGQRPGVQLSLTLGMEELPRRLVEDSPGYFTLFLSIAKNCMGGTAHIFLSCMTVAERDDWLDAMTKTSDEYHGL